MKEPWPKHSFSYFFLQKQLQSKKKSITFALSKMTIRHLPKWRNGRRARFRCECWEACRFESCLGHWLWIAVSDYGFSYFLYITSGFNHIRNTHNNGMMHQSIKRIIASVTIILNTIHQLNLLFPWNNQSSTSFFSLLFQCWSKRQVAANRARFQCRNNTHTCKCTTT